MADTASLKLDDITPVLNVLLNFKNSEPSLRDLEKMAHQYLGEEWHPKLRQLIEDSQAELKNDYLNKLHDLEIYEKALSIWTEAKSLQGLTLDQFDHKKTSKRMEDFEKWLPRFGKAGQDLLARMKELLSGQSREENARQKEIDVPWLVQNFLNVTAYVEQTRVVMGMICVKHKGVPLERYPFYGYLGDLLDYLLKVGKELLHQKDVEALVKDKIQKGASGLQEMLDRFEAERKQIPDFESRMAPISSVTREGLVSALGGLASDEGKAAPDQPVDMVEGKLTDLAPPKT